jgi:sugar phosphate permease
VRERREGPPPPRAQPGDGVSAAADAPAGGRAASGLPRYRWVVLGVGATGAGAFAALRMGLPALGPAIREEFALSLAQVGLAFTAVSVGVALTLIPWGLLTDRAGERPVLAGGLAGTSLALAGAAFAPSFPVLLLGILLAGMAGASATGASGRAVMGWFGRAERGLALGIRQMALPLGGALSSFVLPSLVGLGGLRAALLALSGLTLTAAAAAALWLRDAPALEEGSPAAVYAAAQPPPMRDRRQWRLGAGSALLVLAQSAVLGFLVLFLVDERDLSPALAAALLGVAQLGGAASRIVAGRRSDLDGARLPLLRRVALRNAILLALVAALTAAPGFLLYPVLAAAAVSTMSWNGLAFTAAAELSGRLRAGTAMSLQNTVVAVASSGAPVAFGGLVEAAGWAPGFALCAVAPAVAFAVLRPLQAEEAERARRRVRIPTPRLSRSAT